MLPYLVVHIRLAAFRNLPLWFATAHLVRRLPKRRARSHWDNAPTYQTGGRCDRRYRESYRTLEETVPILPRNESVLRRIRGQQLPGSANGCRARGWGINVRPSSYTTYSVYDRLTLIVRCPGLSGRGDDWAEPSSPLHLLPSPFPPSSRYNELRGVYYGVCEPPSELQSFDPRLSHRCATVCARSRSERCERRRPACPDPKLTHAVLHRLREPPLGRGPDTQTRRPLSTRATLSVARS